MKNIITKSIILFSSVYTSSLNVFSQSNYKNSSGDEIQSELIERQANIIVTSIVCLILFVRIIIGIIVYKNAEKNNIAYSKIWGAIVFTFPLPGIIAYILYRLASKPKQE